MNRHELTAIARYGAINELYQGINQSRSVEAANVSQTARLGDRDPDTGKIFYNSGFGTQTAISITDGGGIGAGAVVPSATRGESTDYLDARPTA
jgi:hypothetical protein